MLKLIPIFAVSCWLALLCCSPVNPSGTSSSTHTKVAGIVKGPDKKVIKGADVFLYPKQKLESGDEMPEDARKTGTDKDGEYKFDEVETGEYYLKATYGDSLAKIDSLVIEKSDHGKTLEKNLTLEITTIIIGSFNRSYVDNSLKQNVTNIYVYNFTTNQKTELNNDGTFTFTNVPKGTYQFVLVKDNEIVSSPLDSLLFDLLQDEATDTVYQYDIGGIFGSLVVKCTAGTSDSDDEVQLEETVERVVAVLERKNHIDSFEVSFTVKKDSIIIGTIDSVFQDSYLSLHITVFDDDSVMIWQGVYDEPFDVEDEEDTLELVLEPVVQLSISVEDHKVLIDRKFLPTVTFIPSEADTLEVVFSSDDSETVDIVDDSLLAVEAGEVEITATAGEAHTTFTVTVVDDAFVISIKDTTITVGQRLAPQVKFDPEEADSIAVTFTSGDEEIVEVNDDTLVAVGTGSVEIAVTAGETSDTFTVTVTDTVSDTGFTITLSDTTVSVGDKFMPAVLFDPEEADSETVTFQSDNEDIVKVNDDTLEALAAGSAEITAEAGEVTTTFNVTVVDTNITITIAVGDAAVQEGNSLTPSITWSPAGIDSLGYTLTSLNTAVVTVDGGKIVGTGAGTALVVAKVNSTEVVDTFSVIVRQKEITGETVTVWFEDFERDGAADDWTADHGTWEAGVPTSGPKSAYEGNNCMATNLTGNYTDNIQSRFIRIKSFTVPSADKNPRLRFQHWFSIGLSDWGWVEIKEVDSTEWKPVNEDIYYEKINSVGKWSYALLDLSDFSDKEVQICFNFTSSSAGGTQVGAGWYIDNIALLTGPMTFNNPEDWEAGIGDWSATHAVWEVGIPETGIDSAYSGKNVLATNLTGKYNDNLQSSFISPPVQIPPAESDPALRFRHWFVFGLSDYGCVKIRQYGTDEWVTVSEEFSGSGGSVWSYPYIDLKDYAGNIVEICFFFKSSSAGGTQTSHGWFIDDIVVLPAE